MARRSAPLTVTQRETIRAIHDNKTTNRASERSLIARGYIDNTVVPYRLTAMGERAYERIMSSGNGPEQLKAMFRF